MSAPAPPPARIIRALVADDEPLARQRIEDLLRHHPDVEIVGTPDTGAATVEAIRALRPDLVFLDVQMPGGTGLDVVREIGVDAMPATIFVTAYDWYALRAFDLAAVDYLVKPFDDDRFEQALARARRTIELHQLGAIREQLLTLLGGAGTGAGPDGARSRQPGAPSPAPGFLERIAVESKGKVRVVPAAQIDYILASGPYAELYVGDRRYLIRESMQALEERLDPERFLRIHRSAIVRLDLVDTLHKGAGGDYEVQLRSGVRLRVSRSRREALERKLGVG